MNASLCTAFALAAAAVAMPLDALAATSAAHLERAQTQASGAQLRSFSVPTSDAAGKVRYYDVTVDLTVLGSGQFDGTAAVTAVPSPKVLSNLFTPGKYVDSAGGKCTIVNGTLVSGRQETSLSCTATNDVWNATWDNGDIAGHPFELQLRSAGIDQIPGYRSYAWGLDGFTSDGYANCFYTNYIVGARQVGNQIVVTRYGTDNLADCGITLTRQP